MRRLRGTLSSLDAIILQRSLIDATDAMLKLGSLLSGARIALESATLPIKKPRSSPTRKKSSARAASFGKKPAWLRANLVGRGGLL